MQINQKSLKKALEQVKPAIPRTSPLKAMEMVRLQTNPELDKLTLTGSGMDLSVKSTMSGQFQSLDLCVDTDRLSDAVNALPEIEATVKDNVLILKGGRSIYRITTLPGADHPGSAYLDNQSAQVVISKLGEMIDRAQWAAAKKNLANPALTGVFFEVQDGKLFVVACNGFCMSVSEAPLPQLGGDFKSVLHHSAATKISKLDVQRFTVYEKAILFDGEGFAAQTQVMQGAYPDWRRLFSEYDLSLMTEREGMVSAIESVRNVSALDELMPIKLISDGLTLTLKTRSPNGHEAECTIDAVGSKFETDLNSSYLLQLIKSCPSDTLEFQGSLTSKQFMLGTENWRGLITTLRV